ncbi:hypothetical protein [Streptomyces sp. NPDC003522]
MAEDPLNSQVELVPVEGAVTVVGEAAYFGFQNRGYLETGDPSRMTIGIGPVRVDLATGKCRMLGSVEAGEMNLFDDDGLALPVLSVTIAAARHQGSRRPGRVLPRSPASTRIPGAGSVLTWKGQQGENRRSQP